MRSCRMITPPSYHEDLDVFTVVSHKKAVRGHRWGTFISKPFLDLEGVGDVPRLATVAMVKPDRPLGELNPTEMDLMLDRLVERFGS